MTRTAFRMSEQEIKAVAEHNRSTDVAETIPPPKSNYPDGSRFAAVRRRYGLRSRFPDCRNPSCQRFKIHLYNRLTVPPVWRVLLYGY
jgi:hypothetical protein